MSKALHDGCGAEETHEGTAASKAWPSGSLSEVQDLSAAAGEAETVVYRQQADGLRARADVQFRFYLLVEQIVIW